MAIVYFQKELLSNYVYVQGKAVDFEQLDGNRGVIALDDTDPKNLPVIAALKEFASKGKGGVSLISLEEYETKKKLHPFNPSGPSSQREMLRLMEDPARRVQQKRDAAAVVSQSNAKPATPGLRLDGPTLEEWVAAGYEAKTYPPEGYAPRAAGTKPIPSATVPGSQPETAPVQPAEKPALPPPPKPNTARLGERLKSKPAEAELGQ